MYEINSALKHSHTLWLLALRKGTIMLFIYGILLNKSKRKVGKVERIKKKSSLLSQNKDKFYLATNKRYELTQWERLYSQRP